MEPNKRIGHHGLPDRGSWIPYAIGDVHHLRPIAKRFDLEWDAYKEGEEWKIQESNILPVPQDE